MIDREKLIELLKKATIEVDEGYPMSHYKCRAVSDDVAACLADHLIANGVTVQRWIPVSERLPEKFFTVLVQMPLEEPCPTVTWGFLKNDGRWYANYFNREDGEVTHWMPLPRPPKGE